MFDLGASELLVIVIVAVLVIGPKDMPLALRTAGRWIGKVRRLSNHFRAGLDAMVREAEMDEMEKKWKAQNERIMNQDPATLPAEMEATGALPSRPRTQHSDETANLAAAGAAEAGAAELDQASAGSAEAGTPDRPARIERMADGPRANPEPAAADSGNCPPQAKPGS